MTPESEAILKTVVQCIEDEPVIGEISKEMRASLHTAMVRGDVDAFIELLNEFTRVCKASIKSRVIRALAPEGSVAQRFGLLYGQMFRWEGRDGQAITWSIEACKELIAGRDCLRGVEMGPREWKQALENNSLAHEIDDAHALTRDLSEPLIAVQSPNPDDPPGAVILIDGWHRVKKAVTTNHDEPLLVHVLDHEEERSCRITQMEHA